ncbi:hypothetical protein ZEAMMB73_Zm00001d032446 [Zea mays]|uniref:RRM domain-containing protein n=1 Tax=Zea mays TaxID=4577 RepID=A0A1D6KQR1_MAIZE|nr:hypothetical protein ZEAMMB73_Zm00001d032446 [Zea mays]
MEKLIIRRDIPFGKVFLEHIDVEGSTKAKTEMHGQKLGGNQVVVVRRSHMQALRLRPPMPNNTIRRH